MANDKFLNIWLDSDTANIMEDYRATKRPVLSKRDALKELVRIGWESYQIDGGKKEDKK